MAKDVYAKKHPATYFNNLLMSTEQDAINMMKRYSLHPPDHAGTLGTTIRTIDNVRTTGEGRDQAIRVANMLDKKVAWLDLTRGKRGQNWQSGNEGGGTLYGSCSYVESPTAVPVYWLPWDTAGAVISLNIPRMGSGRPDEPDPNRFFTAAINGCSVFFVGNPDAPTVYHCGGSTYISNHDKAAKFWRDLVTRMGGTPAGEVNKTDYIKTEGVKDSHGFDTTQAAKDYQTWLTSTYQELEIEEVRPWGCVMGLRDDDGNWKFYLQQNVSVGYYTLKKKGVFSKTLVRQKEAVTVTQTSAKGKVSVVKKKDRSGNTIMVDRQRTVSRPISFYEVYPNQALPVRIQAPIPKTKHG
ncbi:MAG: hypothetical protein KDA45_00835 [Planctomycetales bacterium]|nr:hypothetical protein [Planctomycetales bacterium]